MKKTLLCTGLIAAAFAAQAQTDKKNNFKLNIFSPIVKTGSFFYERKLNDKSSAQLGVGFTSFGKSDGVKLSGIFITPEYRFYPSENALSGFYVGPFLRFQSLKLEDKTAGSSGKATLTTFGGGAVIGRQWVFGDIVSFDIFAGPSFNTGKVKVQSGDDEFDVPGSFEGFGARVGITVGVNF
ncbi:MAG: DUF3575 domain-containing protein [Chitinophagaceae bacterium]|nr:MAG: DUF3575 domain-containing protein [Chitinophagaceae bacterium]